MSTTLLQKTTAAATASTHFLTVILVDYIEKVSETAGEKAGDLVDAAKVATYKIDLYSDKMYLVGTFNGHLKTVAEEIEELELLVQGAQEGTFDDRADIIIDKIEHGGDFHTLRAKIIALKDFRDLAMEASQPKSKRLIEYLKNTANAGQLAVINALRNAFGYAPIVLGSDIDGSSDDVELEMEDLDVIHNVVALAFDPFDATNLHNVGITRLELKNEIVKMLKMAYAGRMIASQADSNRELQYQIDIVKGRDFLMKQLSIEYTVMLTKGQNPGPLLNQIAELMRNANIMTRNTMDLVKKDLAEILPLIPLDPGEALSARSMITLQLGKMDTDATEHGGIYMSQRFKYNRIPPIIKALTIYVLSLKGSDHFKRAQEIITEYNQYIEEIHAARLEIYNILRRRNLVPNLGKDAEAYEVFITKTINTYVPTQAFPSAFPERIGMQELERMNMSNNERNRNYNPGSNEEDPDEKNKNNQVFGEITSAMKKSGRTEDGNGDTMNITGSYRGGKRKQTRKRSSKKSKKSKKTKRMKKVKRTMKKNKGKKGKKASRKRR